MDELINGTVDGWPCSIMLMSNPGERWVGIHAAPYTDANDNSAPDAIARKISDLEGGFKTRRAALAHAKKGGFVATGEVKN